MSKQISTLYLTGANNHDWERTGPFLRDVLSASGDFAVTYAEDASTALEADLARFDLLFLDYNGPLWSEAAQANFLQAVKSGKGVVVLHAADNAFPGWVEYEKLVGLMWREGTGHGKFHAFTVTIQNAEHPITAGLTDFVTEDELYHRLVPMHGTPVEVLASAYSSPESGGTGELEPMLMTTHYGAGRVFHTALGHVWKGSSLAAVENAAFQETLLRGARWAAEKH
ncbi:ThuA domain-containing protein [Armatimonas rosea]|uniref:Type 1 glutamine amidotransferase n=1 Tax=Armatimonas rosea TaxID=685828 RepID=A0A7W9SNW6_ARMRO|nr:ThuA domain-containing protein [Armatimonas rosea]MBB6050107.1 type 1 glutamine amidotransferase [Armatimonas rosea]